MPDTQPETPLGTRLARQRLDTDHPIDELSAKHPSAEPLHHLSRAIISLINELDAYDRTSELERRALVARATRGRLRTADHRGNAYGAQAAAARMEHTCIRRDLTATHLSLLLTAYHAATSTSAQKGNRS
ncbi:hypothetical protein [Streptomyces malaysiensis]|uniref:hypothetical protein n=1 Tax=Streptomyces malaysiensis TaxID=92644 RepID=UPI0011CDC4CE|nr:hypothetical protein [Streptomyces malaysiensis]